MFKPSLFFKGLLIGIADMIPGISGGTLAFILGIYTPLLKGLQAFNLSFFKALITFNTFRLARAVDWKFFLPLLLGVFTAFTLLAGLMKKAFAHSSIAMCVFSLFFGLILASCALLIRKISPYNVAFFFWSFIGVALACALASLHPSSSFTPSFAPSYGFLFLCGASGAAAMLAPGISGSYLMLIIGIYPFLLDSYLSVLQELFSLKLSLATCLPLGVYALGVLLGLAIFSRVIDACLKHYPHSSFSMICGFILGSLPVIWPFRQLGSQEFLKAPLTLFPQSAFAGGLAVFFILVGFLALRGLVQLENKACSS